MNGCNGSTHRTPRAHISLGATGNSLSPGDFSPMPRQGSQGRQSLSPIDSS
jgi:hypothetical protein